jgi:glutamine synthetase
LKGGKLKARQKRTDTRLAQEVLEKIKRERIRYIDLQFVDVPGYLQHITIPSHWFDLNCFEEGFGKLDGSSIKGFKPIYESDMILVPAPETFAVLPWSPAEQRTARILTNIYESYGGARFERDSRYLAQKAEDAVRKAGFTVSYWGPELEFFVFDKVELFPSALAARDAWAESGYRIESKEAIWSKGGINFPIRFKEGYYPAPPEDTFQEYRSEVCSILEDYFDVKIDAHHHEVATAGQAEIDMKYAPLVKMADSVISYKHVVKMVAHLKGMIATFMPKPIFGDNASGMHVHQSLWKGSKNAFYDPDDEYAELSQIGRYYIGGLIENSLSLAAIVAPTTNSYKRLVPGYEAPVYAAWSRSNRSANVRVPVYFRGGKTGHDAKRVEFRPPDPACNPYLAFAAQLSAGLDGIKRKLDPGDPVDENIYLLSPERRRQLGIKELPGSLAEALDELESDHTYLNGIFTSDLLETFIEIKREESKQQSLRPTPYEFYLYLDI